MSDSKQKVYVPPIKPGNKGPTRNDRTLKWPKMMEDGKFTAAYRAFSEDMSVCYDLVDIGSYIVGRRLVLVAGGPRQGITKAATDGTKIFLPKMHPARRVATKHELSHIFFKSNLALRLAFVRGMIKKFEEDRGRPLALHLKGQMTDDLCFFINILDDWRVNSLWGLIYPGDGRDMDEHYVDKIGPAMMKKAQKIFKNGDVDHLFTYAILLCLDQPAQSSKWGEFEDDIIQTRDDVLWTSFPSCLVACRHLVEKILKKVAEDMEEAPQPQPDPLNGLQADPKQAGKDLGDADDSGQDLSQTGPNQSIEDDIKAKQREKAAAAAADKALQELFKGKKPSAIEFRSDNAGFDDNHQIPERKVTDPIITSQVLKLLKIDPKDAGSVQDFLDRAGDAGAQQAQQIKKKLDARARDPLIQKSDYLKKAVKADLQIIKVKRERLRAAALSPEDLEVAEKWRKQVIRAMGALQNRMVHQGGRLSVPDLIRAQQSGMPIPCFRREVTGRGFEVIISVDMSGSMAGSLFAEVERLVLILRRALDFPFVKMRVQGWASKEDGGVTLYDYPVCTGNEGLVSPESRAGGVTPLSFAVQLAGQSLRNSRNERHVFLLSDGFPVYRLKNKSQYMQTGALQEWTRDAVQELRKQRIRCWCWMIGRHVPRDGAMDQMFGPRNWRKINVEQLYQDGFDFLTQQFLAYLRSR